MPRKSAAALSVASIDVAARRIKPPEALPDPAKSIWRELVESLPGERFHKSDGPLLALYCRALHQAQLAFAEVERTVATDGEAVNPWLKVADVFTKQCAVLSTKLRLCPQSRMDRKTAGPAARQRPDKPPWE